MSIVENDPIIEQDSEDDFDWEEVEVPVHEQHLEITIQAAGSRPKKDVNKNKGISHAERLIRIDCHKLHTVSLLANAWVRNKWINDPLLHARLLSLTPLPLQNAFGMIHKSRVPNQNMRGRMFETAITNLADWWSSTFFEVTYDGHIRNRTYDSVQTKLNALGLSSGPEALLDPEDVQDILGEDAELIRSPKSLMKHALMQSGSRDTSAQLFTALCRGLGIPARLVVSLQSVPWQTSVGKPKSTYQRKKGDKAKGKAKESSNVAEAQGDNGNDLEEVDMSGSRATSVSGSDIKGKGKAVGFIGDGQRLDGETVTPKSDKAKGKEKAKPVIKLRKTKDKGNVLGSGPELSSASSSRLASPDPATTPPVFWTEVFSRPDARWIPVDPIRCIINKRKVFDPAPTSVVPTPQPGATIFPHPYAQNRKPTQTLRTIKQENRMVYVLAFEEDGYARDITRRYAREYSAKIMKVQGGSSTIGGGGKARQAWWQRVLSVVSRPYRLHRDDLEDEELEEAQLMEGMPTTVSGFKDHPLYALTRHLKQNQVIHPPPPETSELGKFRGEPVYPRSSVVSLKTAENWMRSEGRAVKEGCQALKFVKARAGTIGRMRELEVMKDGLKEAGEQIGASEAMQGLYARHQTEMYKPDPVVNGKVPKNNFGNIDLYVPSMLPLGAAHVPFKGAAKIARKLGLDYAEAVTGFEFKKRRAFPILEGVVVAEENEASLLEAYWEAEQDAEEKARAKREERVIKHWARLVQGLRIRQRLEERYVTKPDKEQDSHGNMTIDVEDDSSGSTKDTTMDISNQAGGFLIGADDVVEPFHLPKYKYQPLVEPYSVPSTSSIVIDPPVTSAPPQEIYENTGVTYDLQTMDVDSDIELEEVPVNLVEATDQLKLDSGPKTMREMAEDAAKTRRRRTGEEPNSDNDAVELVDTDVYRPSPDLFSAMQTNDVGSVKIKITPRPLRSSKQPDTPTAPSNSATKGPRRTARRVSTRTTSRKRERSHDSDDHIINDENSSQPSPKKRAAKSAKSSVPATPTPSTRTLRPRASKTAAQLLEEEKLEEAYKRAIGR